MSLPYKRRMLIGTGGLRLLFMVYKKEPCFVLYRYLRSEANKTLSKLAETYLSGNGLATCFETHLTAKGERLSSELEPEDTAILVHRYL